MAGPSRQTASTASVDDHKTRLSNQPKRATVPVRRSLFLPAVAMAALGVGCSNGVPPQPPPTTATSNVSFKMGASGTSKCTAYIRREWRPVSVANSTGRSTSLALPTSGFDHLEVAATNDGQRTACYFNGSSGLQGLAPGDWEISL